MNYFIFRRSGAFGRNEYISDFEPFTITDDIRQARQVSEQGLDFLDIPYINSLGFYPVNIVTYGVTFLPNLLFIPPRRRYRPILRPRPPVRYFGPFFGGPMGNRPGGGRPPGGGNRPGGGGRPGGDNRPGGSGRRRRKPSLITTQEPRVTKIIFYSKMRQGLS